MDNNDSESWITTWGNYDGGRLRVGTEEEYLELAGPDKVQMWERFHGGCTHWNTPFEGDRWSLICYLKTKGRKKQEVTQKGDLGLQYWDVVRLS